MGSIIPFPAGDDHRWKAIEESVRRCYAHWPDADGTLEEMLPQLRKDWALIYPPENEVCVSLQVPDSALPDDVRAAVHEYTAQARDMVLRLNNSRAAALGMVIAYHFQSTHYRRILSK
jgi:hypothetical protein